VTRRRGNKKGGHDNGKGETRVRWRQWGRFYTDSKKTSNGRKRRSRSEEHLVHCEPNQKTVYKKAKNHRVLKKWPNCIGGGIYRK
jgi:hypothetical protein